MDINIFIFFIGLLFGLAFGIYIGVMLGINRFGDFLIRKSNMNYSIKKEIKKLQKDIDSSIEYVQFKTLISKEYPYYDWEE